MPPKRQRDEKSQGEHHKKRLRASSDQISIRALQEVLKYRLSAISAKDIDRLQDAESLSVVAASMSQIENMLQHRWDIPDQLYSVDEKDHLHCRFPGCSPQTSFTRAWNLSTHVKRCHGVMGKFMDSEKCILCEQEMPSGKALQGHERGDHKLQYRVRAEIFAPYFAAFQGISNPIAYLVERY